MTTIRNLFAHMIAGAALIAISATAHAQSATKAQQDAIRANCRSDFMRNCSSVTPGGREALMCLEQNKAKLSAGCKGAVDAVSAATAPKPTAPVEAKPQAAPTPPAAAPAATAPAEKPAPVATAPAAPAPKKPAAKPVPAPKAAAAPARPSAPPAAAPAAPVAVSPPTTAPETARRPTLGEAMLIRRFCANDYRVLCKGTQIGGGRALKCLADNAPALSPGCKSAMANAAN